MSEDQIEVVREMYEAYLAGDAESALDHFHADARVDLSVRGDIGVVTGRQETGKAATSWVGSWDDYSEEIDEIRDLGNLVLLVTTQRGRGKGSGIEISNQWAFLIEIRDDRIARLTGYANVDSALEAAGLSE